MEYIFLVPICYQIQFVPKLRLSFSRVSHLNFHLLLMTNQNNGTGKVVDNVSLLITAIRI